MVRTCSRRSSSSAARSWSPDFREFLAELNQIDKIKVSQLAKWKTTLQMVALGFLVAGPAADRVIVPGMQTLGLGLLWLAALLTLITGYDYLRVAVKHAIDD